MSDDTVCQISVVVATVGRPPLLTQLLRSVVKCRPLPAEVIVSDGSGRPATHRAVQRIRRCFAEHGSRLLHITCPRGLTRQRIAGVRASSCPLVVFLDDDTAPCAEFFAALVEEAESDAARQVGGFGFMITRPDCGDTIPGGGRYDRKGRPRALGASMSGQVHFLAGCAAYRREVFARFRPAVAFGGYAQGEDRLFSGLVGTRWRLRIVADARLTHFEAGEGRPAGFAKGFTTGRNHVALGLALVRVGADYPALPYAVRLFASACFRAGQSLLSMRLGQAAVHVGRACGVAPGLLLGLCGRRSALGLSGVLE